MIILTVGIIITIAVVALWLARSEGEWPFSDGDGRPLKW